MMVMSGAVNLFRKIGEVHQHKNLGKPVDNVGYRVLTSTMNFGSKILERLCSYEQPLLLGETSSVIGIASPFSAVTVTECTIISFGLKQFYKYISTASDASISRFTDDC